MISINGLTVAYGGYTLLDNIDFHISEKDKIGLVGKNGAGKSTIMKLICGLQSPTSGSIDKPNDLLHRLPSSDHGASQGKNRDGGDIDGFRPHHRDPDRT